MFVQTSFKKMFVQTVGLSALQSAWGTTTTFSVYLYSPQSFSCVLSNRCYTFCLFVSSVQKSYFARGTLWSYCRSVGWFVEDVGLSPIKIWESYMGHGGGHLYCYSTFSKTMGESLTNLKQWALRSISNGSQECLGQSASGYHRNASFMLQNPGWILICQPICRNQEQHTLLIQCPL